MAVNSMQSKMLDYQHQVNTIMKEQHELRAKLTELEIKKVEILQEMEKEGIATNMGMPPAPGNDGGGN